MAEQKRPRRARTSEGVVVKDQVAVADVILDSDVQPREHISTNTISEYADAMREGKSFPEIIVYRDPESGALIAADGWHRTMAAKQADKATILAEIRPGTKRDAILYSVSANAEHGLRRSNDDKRRAVARLLDDDEWGQWSDNVIAEKVGVSQPFVSGMRKQREGGSSSDEPRVVVTADGKSMDTSKIGRARKPKEAPVVVPVEATNGHAPVALVPDDDDDDDDNISTLDTAAPFQDDEDDDEQDDGSLTVEEFAQCFTAIMLKMPDFEPGAVFAALDKDALNQLADNWDNIVGKIDSYSDALEHALDSVPV